MSKELEAITRLKNINWFCPKNVKDTLYTFYKNDFDVIEKELKDYELTKQTKVIVANKKISDEDLEKLKNQRMFVGNLEQCEVKPLLDEETEKKLKALDIIKDEFEISFKDKEQAINFQSVEKPYTHIRFSLTRIIKDKEKYDLLKEVLL